jgi:hypothetical protein
LTNHFPQAFKRDFPEKYKKVKSFQELLNNFHNWGKSKAPMTDKQTKALAIEANYIHIKDTNKQDKRGVWHNIVTGQIVKGQNEPSKIPIWRENDTRKERGSVVNVTTGEKYKLRYAKGKHKGQLMKKEKWTYTDKKGKTKLIYPKEKKKKESEAMRASRLSKARALKQQKKGKKLRR